MKIVFASRTGNVESIIDRLGVEAVRIEDEIRRVKGLPVSKYDYDKDMTYIEYPDGRRVYAEET